VTSELGRHTSDKVHVYALATIRYRLIVVTRWDGGKPLIRLPVSLTVDLWPWKPFQQCPLI